eukprot:scaffold234125_cov50-Prasinocladus_malaysianus.AAC.1
MCPLHEFDEVKRVFLCVQSTVPTVDLGDSSDEEDEEQELKKTADELRASASAVASAKKEEDGADVIDLISDSDEDEAPAAQRRRLEACTSMGNNVVPNQLPQQQHQGGRSVLSTGGSHSGYAPGATPMPNLQRSNRVNISLQRRRADIQQPQAAWQGGAHMNGSLPQHQQHTSQYNQGATPEQSWNGMYSSSRPQQFHHQHQQQRPVMQQTQQYDNSSQNDSLSQVCVKLEFVHIGIVAARPCLDVVHGSPTEHGAHIAAAVSWGSCPAI